MKKPIPFKTILLIVLTPLFLCGCAESKKEQNETNLLKDVFADSFLMGIAVNDALIEGENDKAQNLLLTQFNTFTPENCMKAGPLSPQPGVYDFTTADKYVEFGQKHNYFIVGHTLIWHNQTPDWFFKDENGMPNSPAQQKEQLRSHIETVAGRYAGKVDAWDVVNEVIDNDGSYRPTTWVNAIGDGDELVKLAFKYASEYAPDTELYYNDFNAWRPEKRDGIVRMVKMLQAEGIRIDGIGMQGHWGLNYPKNEYIEETIDAYAALGIKVMITELDIDVLPLTKEGQIIGTGLLHPQYELEEFKEFLDPYRDGLPSEIEIELAQRYHEIFEIFYEKRDKIDRVTFWGLDDSMSWKNDYPINNRINYPLLYDRNFDPKLPVTSIQQVVK